MTEARISTTSSLHIVQPKQNIHFRFSCLINSWIAYLQACCQSDSNQSQNHTPESCILLRIVHHLLSNIANPQPMLFNNETALEPSYRILLSTLAQAYDKNQDTELYHNLLSFHPLPSRPALEVLTRLASILLYVLLIM